MRLFDMDSKEDYLLDGKYKVATPYAPLVNVVEVVRCKDCRWWTKQEKSIQGRCALTGTYPTGGWYCGNGERRDDEIDRR